jgi:hypothetical protein
MEKQKPYVDFSNFQGWKQFYTESGVEVRAEYKGGGLWNIYIRHGKDDAFSLDRTIRLTRGNRDSCLAIWIEYCNQSMNSDE